ncbi:translesion error-prone DNA polymerase V autoproteolytic subunit [Chrysiogenes arsenatis]|uniref:translesion error-prone DNA polymerase V autoproteolytic subunit n=1 Tax=Chrysiogenes arsenatis TaxID=309797 RepID=UPI0003FDAE52|nr:translesion error-prone DNA polymerase V autoproteolytic subunit [Chrysiogenes arsenatis]
MSIAILGTCQLPDKPLQIPLYVEAVRAGFPSPAQDYIEKMLDLNELCIRNPTATFFVRAEGDSMREAGIAPGDILIVDRSLEAQHGDIVVAGFHGELTVKKLEMRPTVRLVPMNSFYAPIEVPDGADVDIFGVVTTIIHAVKRLL